MKKIVLVALACGLAGFGSISMAQSGGQSVVTSTDAANLAIRIKSAAEAAAADGKSEAEITAIVNNIIETSGADASVVAVALASIQSSYPLVVAAISNTQAVVLAQLGSTSTGGTGTSTGGTAGSAGASSGGGSLPSPPSSAGGGGGGYSATGT
ncbi:MAG: hypothetical protein RL186_435 [Pseudomonadota bacterium]|jgi:hypothetical protein